MSLVWDKMRSISSKVLKQLDQYQKIELEPQYHSDTGFTWENHLYTSDTFRRAHVEIVDAREHKKIWVMHMTIFPHWHDPTPIFGFDAVCGANKITGLFHDFSKLGECPTYDWYQDRMLPIIKQYTKPRDLPDWAQRIFSPCMVSVGNISEAKELDLIDRMFGDNLQYYLENVGKYRTYEDHKDSYNDYCKNQKLNPHTPKMMESLGIDKLLFRNFIDHVLFPEHYD